MSLNANRGLPPGELPASGTGALAALIINLGNGRQAVLVGFKAKGISARVFRPAWWYASSDPDAATVKIDVRKKTHGSGSMTTIFSGALAGGEPTITSPATENDGSCAGWPDFTPTEWAEVHLLTKTVGSPTQVSLTIHGSYV